MKNTTILIVIGLILAVAAIGWLGKNNSVEAPVVNETTDNNTTNTVNHEDIEDINHTSTNSNTSTEVKTEVKVTTTAPVKKFTVDGKNFSFTPNVISVKKGDKVEITFKNTGGFHDLVINEYNVATKQIQTGAEETITFIADKAGSFEYYCSVGTHRAMGMWGTLKVE